MFIKSQEFIDPQHPQHTYFNASHHKDSCSKKFNHESSSKKTKSGFLNKLLALLVFASVVIIPLYTFQKKSDFKSQFKSFDIKFSSIYLKNSSIKIASNLQNNTPNDHEIHIINIRYSIKKNGSTLFMTEDGFTKNRITAQHSLNIFKTIKIPYHLQEDIANNLEKMSVELEFISNKLAIKVVNPLIV